MGKRARKSGAECAMKRRAILICAAVLIVGALIVRYLQPKALIKPVTVKVLGLVGDPRPEPGTNLWTVSVALSNTTPKDFSIAFPTLQTRSADGWTNYC